MTSDHARCARQLILLVSDDPDVQRAARENVEARLCVGHLQIIADGGELLDHLRRCGQPTDLAGPPRPGLILLDLSTRRLDGREALRAIKSAPELRSIPTIVLADSGAGDSIARFYDDGANSCVAKRATYEGLAETMEVIGRYWFEIVEAPEVAQGA